jgi:hypothetical protein
MINLNNYYIQFHTSPRLYAEEFYEGQSVNMSQMEVKQL